MTLVFLGSRDPGDVDAIAEAAFSRVDSPAPVVEIEPEPVGLPRGKRPGLFALEARSPQAEALQAQVVAGLAAAGLHEPEERPVLAAPDRGAGAPGQARLAQAGGGGEAARTATEHTFAYSVRPRS